MHIMYTMRDVDDLKLERRATMALPWLTDIMHACEANLAARQQEAERSRRQAEEERQAQARSLDEQIAAAVAAAIRRRPTGTHRPARRRWSPPLTRTRAGVPSTAARWSGARTSGAPGTRTG